MNFSSLDEKDPGRHMMDKEILESKWTCLSELACGMYQKHAIPKEVTFQNSA